MNQNLLYHAFGVREGYEYQKTEYVEGRVEFHLRAKDELLKCPDCGHEPVRRRGRADPHGADRAEGSRPGHRSAALPVPAVRQNLRRLPPFAPAYAHYTHSLARFVCALSRWMTLQEVATVTHLSWDSVKQIVQS